MKVVITGGAGFLGTNLALKLAANGNKVTVLDNFSRKGTKENLKFLKENINSKKLKIIKADIRDKDIAEHIRADAIFHLAAQTAVTTSVTGPRNDFDVNAYGTFNLLEAVRLGNPKALFVYSSTNKVYGSLDYLKAFPTNGINESFNLDFHSPYGVSKGTADAYTLDYARIYGLNTVVFRQSCIYGLHQLGIEDQGWVAHIGAAALFDKPINVFGTGAQVRDLLFADDLTDLYLKTLNNFKKVKGKVFNVGGGTKNAISVKGYLDFLEKHLNKNIKIKKLPSRPGDQSYFVADNSKIKKYLGWQPETNLKAGIPKMLTWISDNKKLFESFHS